MKKLRERLKVFSEEYIEATSMPVVLGSALGAVILTYFIIMLVMNKLYEGTVVYDSLISGTISYYDYFKQGDKRLVYLFLLGSVSFFYLILMGINYIRKSKLYMVPAFFVQLGIACMYLYYMITGQATKKQAVAFAMLFLIVSLCGKSREKLEAVTQFTVFGEILVTSIVLVGSKFGKIAGIGWVNQAESKLALLQLLVLVLAAIYPLLYENRIPAYKLNKLNFVLGMCSVLWLLWYAVFIYEYRGEVVAQYFSVKYLIIVLVIAGIVLIVNTKQLFSCDFQHSVMARGSIEIAAIFTYLKMPNPLIRTEPILMFHRGEYTVASQQLSSYGKIPFWDIFPIHGLCDYYYGIINRIFFDGSYANLEAALVLGDIILLAILAAVIKRSCNNSTMVLAVILLLFNFTDEYLLYYIRWVIVLPYLLILNTKKIYKNSAGRVWFYVMLTIVSICWNPSIGGSAAIALLPVVLKDILNVFKEIIENIQKKQLSVKFCTAYGVMLVTGILFIPMFWKILQYIGLHTENILIVNSNPLTYMLEDYGLHKSFTVTALQNNGFYILFSFLIPVMFAAVLRQIVKKEIKKSVGSILIQFVIFTLFITNYTFGLICAGERAFIYSGILIMFLMFFLANAAMQEKYQWHKYILFLILLFSIKIVNTTDYTDTENVFANMGTIDSEAVYVTEENSDVSQIQEGYISNEGLEYINGISEIIEYTKARGEVLDLSNMLSVTSILDLELITPYTSAYNMYNETIQKDVLNILEEKKPKIVLLAPYFGDGRPLAPRNYWIVRWIQSEGYNPYIYRGNLFLARKDLELNWAEDGYAQYAALITPTTLDMLPYYWGSDILREKYITSSEKAYIDYDNIEAGKKVCIENLKVADFVRVTVQSENMVQAKGRLGIKGKGKNIIYFDFDIRNGEMLIPIGLSPELQNSKEIELLELEILEGDISVNAEVAVYMEESIEPDQFRFTEE